MTQPTRPRIVLLGSGNVASCLAPALAEAADIIQVYSPTLTHAQRLADKIGAAATDDIAALSAEGDFYIIAVKDDAVAPLTAAVRMCARPEAWRRGIWCHTSGSSPLSVLDGLGEGRCVFYPLQTFTAGDAVDPASVTMLLEGDCAATVGKARRLASAFTSRIHEADSPLQTFTAGDAVDPASVTMLLEGDCAATVGKARRLASAFTSRIHEADSAKRRRIHLAAVFASNFANHMWSQAQKILAPDGLDLSMLEPLIEATLRKAVAIGPHEGQTGPARRGDTAVMSTHMDMLDPQEASLYRCVSSSIASDYRNNHPQITES